MGPGLGPHACTDRTSDTRVAEPRPPAPEDGRLGKGQRLTSDAPHNGGRQPPPGKPFRHPHSEQRRPARAHAVGPGLSPHARTDRTRDTRVTEPGRPLQRTGGWGGDSACHQTPLTTVAGHPPPGTVPHHPRGTQPPQGMQAKGPPHLHTRAHSKWVADPNSPPSGRAVG